MKVVRNYRYRLLPNKVQKNFFRNCFGACRFLYNTILHDSIDHYEKNKTPFRYTLAPYKESFPWLSEVDSFAIAYARKNLNTAFVNFFKRKDVNFPKYKSKKDERNLSYTTYSASSNPIKFVGNKVNLPKIGLVKCIRHRDIPEGSKIKHATISQIPSGEYYVSILFEFEVDLNFSPIDVSTAIGLDYSSPHCYVDSEGNKGTSRHFYRFYEKKISTEQRKLDKMKKGGKNREKQRVKLARLFRRVKNRRLDWCHKKSREISNTHDLVCIEDINLSTVGKSLKLGKSTLDNGFGYLKKQISYKLQERGGRLITIAKFFPSSKTCSVCGHVFKELSINDRKWVCDNCNTLLDRDFNAAINIRNEGVKNYAESLNRGSHGDSLLILGEKSPLSRKEPPRKRRGSMTQHDVATFVANIA